MKNLSVAVIENILLQSMSEWHEDTLIPIDEGKPSMKPPYRGPNNRMVFRSVLDQITNQTVEDCLLAIDRDFREAKYVKIVPAQDTITAIVIYNLLQKQQVIDQLTGQNNVFKIVKKCTKYLTALRELNFE